MPKTITVTRPVEANLSTVGHYGFFYMDNCSTVDVPAGTYAKANCRIHFGNRQYTAIEFPTWSGPCTSAPDTTVNIVWIPNDAIN